MSFKSAGLLSVNQVIRKSKLKSLLLALFLCISLGIGFGIFSNPVTAQTSPVRQVILFDDVNFRGFSKIVVSSERDLSADTVNNWNDRVSSIAVVNGRWRFFENANYSGTSVTLGPGIYANVVPAGLCNDCLTSLRPIN